MAEPVSNLVLDAFLARLTGTTAAGTNVVGYRATTPWVEDGDALSVYCGDERPIERRNEAPSQLERPLEVTVDVWVSSTSSTKAARKLNRLVREVERRCPLVAILRELPETVAIDAAKSHLVEVARDVDSRGRELPAAARLIWLLVYVEDEPTEPEISPGDQGPLHSAGVTYRIEGEDGDADPAATDTVLDEVTGSP